MFPFVMADVAQLGEHLIVAQVAEGSTPFIRPIFSPAAAGLFLYPRSGPLRHPCANKEYTPDCPWAP